MNTLGLSTLRSCGTVEWWTGSGWNHLFSLILMDSACKACFGIGMKKNERLDWQSPHQQSMADLAGAMETVPVSGICSCWVAQLNGYGDCSVPRLWWVASLHKMKKSWGYWEEKKWCLKKNSKELQQKIPDLFSLLVQKGVTCIMYWLLCFCNNFKALFFILDREITGYI